MFSSWYLTYQCYIAFLKQIYHYHCINLHNQFIIHSFFLAASLSATLLGLHKLAGKFFRLSISKLPSSDLKPVKSDFAAKFDVSTSVGPFLSAFVAWLDRSNSTFIFTPEWSGGLRKKWLA